MNTKLFVFIVTIVALLTATTPVVAQLPFAIDFESGDLCGWTGCATITPVDVSSEALGNGHAHYEIEFDLVARGRDVCIERAVERSATPNSQNGIWYRLKNDVTTYSGGDVDWTVDVFGPPPQGTTPNHWRFAVGVSRRVKLMLDLDNTVNAGVASFYAAQLTGLSFDADCSDSDGDHVFPLNISTPHVYVGSSPD